MRNLKYILYSLVLLFLFQECKHAEETGRGRRQKEPAPWKPPLGILDLPVNSPEKNAVVPKTYQLFQTANSRYKENGVVIESLDGGKRERLWFASSRPDTSYLKSILTNYYQQIYFTERSVDGGKCMDEGWGSIRKFRLESNSNLSDAFVNTFNNATKGSPAIAGNTMIIACDNLDAKDQSGSYKGDDKDLWQLTKTGAQWGSPKRLVTLSGDLTWDTQPALSPDGKHLFFVSDRFVSDDGKTVDPKRTGIRKNIFYSWFDGKDWKSPVLVSELVTSKGTENITPSIDPESDVLYFSSNRGGEKHKIFEVPLELLKSGGYKLKTDELSTFKSPLLYDCDGVTQMLKLNESAHTEYPVVYRNKLNKIVPQAFLWSTDDQEGYGGFDLYACAKPLKIEYNVVLVEKSDIKAPGRILYPVLALSGAENKVENAERAMWILLSGLKYQVKGGSNATSQNTFYTMFDEKFIFVGYTGLNRTFPKPGNRELFNYIIKGAEVNSQLTERYKEILINNIVQDTVIHDTVFITKAWEKKPPCPTIRKIPPKHDSVAYFQTGYWEVNTTANLKRDLEKMHVGFEVQGNDIFNPTPLGIKRIKSDYIVPGIGAQFPIILKDTTRYSIADARWIELHPNNTYWGDLPKYESTKAARMQGRKARIAKYVEFAKKVDENLEAVTTRVKTEYFSLLSKPMEFKPRLLIEIYAVSDQREAGSDWYIGDVIEYRGSRLIAPNKFYTEPVKIVPPKVDEKNKKLVEILPCTVRLNAQGNNGTKLGIGQSTTETNTNLSKLRAWFGYKEVYNRLIDNEFFSKSVKQGKVALPDNNVNYENAEIIIITEGRRDQVANTRIKYPPANNPGGQGYFDFDQVRRIEIIVSFLYPEDSEILKSYWCDPAAVK